MRPRCKHCDKRIKWISTPEGWRVFDFAKTGPFYAHVCDKKDLTPREKPKVEPWWTKD